MAIIKKKVESKKQKVKAEISSDVLDQINKYMSWADISDLGYFLEEASLFVFKNDKDWKQHNKHNKEQLEQNEG